MTDNDCPASRPTTSAAACRTSSTPTSPTASAWPTPSSFKPAAASRWAATAGIPAAGAAARRWRMASIGAGVEVLDIGLCGTEEIYLAAQQAGVDGGIQVTASHNPMDYNGMKLVRGGAIPVSGDSGLRELEAHVAASTATAPTGTPPMMAAIVPRDYVQHLLGYVDRAQLQAADDRGQRRQWRRRRGDRRARAAAALQVHQAAPRAGRQFPATAFPTRCCRRIARHHPTRCTTARRRLRRRLGRRLRPLLPVRRARRASSRAITSSACSPRRCSSASPAARSSTTRA